MQALFQVDCARCSSASRSFYLPMSMYYYNIIMFISYFCTINDDFIARWQKSMKSMYSSMTIQNSYIMTFESLNDIIPVLT